ncbi:TlpA disulfide reductase family protein [Xenophilus aerolatus]|nr:TlpA disulfide reductase family protein [Xenophilus aerolatus]
MHPTRRQLLAGAAAGLAGAAWAPVHAQPAPATGLARWRPARPPRLEATELQSEEARTLADFAGRPLLVNVWATWCGPCRVEMPSLNALAQQLAPQGWQFVALNHGEMPERVRRFLVEVPIHGTVLLDRSQSVFKAWGGQALPATFVFDGAGRPLVWAQGERDWAAPAMVAALRGLPVARAA